jgi:hypothetical protein
MRQFRVVDDRRFNLEAAWVPLWARLDLGQGKAKALEAPVEPNLGDTLSSRLLRIAMAMRRLFCDEMTAVLE